MACSRCGGEDHDRRTCPQKALADRVPGPVWEWFGASAEAATPPYGEIMRSVAAVPKVMGVALSDHADHVMTLTNENRKAPAQRRHQTKLYVTVAGRQSMLTEAQKERDLVVTENTDLFTIDTPGVGKWDRVLICQATIKIEAPTERIDDLYTLGVKQGTVRILLPEKPWIPPIEDGETSARGRALGAWGFGVLPGSGIATLDEMRRAEWRPAEKAEPTVKDASDLDPEELTVRLWTGLAQLSEAQDWEPEEALNRIKGQALAMGVTLRTDGPEPPCDLSELGPVQLNLIVTKIENDLRRLGGIVQVAP